MVGWALGMVGYERRGQMVGQDGCGGGGQRQHAALQQIGPTYSDWLRAGAGPEVGYRPVMFWRFAKKHPRLTVMKGFIFQLDRRVSDLLHRYWRALFHRLYFIPLAAR